MKFDKNTTAIILALITASAGFGTAVMNRYTPNDGAIVESEKASRKGYDAVQNAMWNITEDVDELAARIGTLEQSISLQNKVIQFLLTHEAPHVRDTSANLPTLPTAPVIESRVPTKVRGKMPSYDAAQRAPVPRQE